MTMQMSEVRVVRTKEFLLFGNHCFLMLKFFLLKVRYWFPGLLDFQRSWIAMLVSRVDLLQSCRTWVKDMMSWHPKWCWWLAALADGNMWNIGNSEDGMNIAWRVPSSRSCDMKVEAVQIVHNNYQQCFFFNGIVTYIYRTCIVIMYLETYPGFIQYTHYMGPQCGFVASSSFCM